MIVILIILPLLRLYNWSNPSTQTLQLHQSDLFKKSMKKVVHYTNHITQRPPVIVYSEAKNKDGCHIDYINPFDPLVNKYMKDFGEHQCHVNNELQVINKQNKLTISGFNINFFECAEIIPANTAEGFRHLSYKKLTKPIISKVLLSLGKTGAIQHILSSRCIAPVKYDLLHPPAEIDLQFTSACVGDQALFTTLESGLIVHNLTKKCIAPFGGSQTPDRNTKLVLSDICTAMFNFIEDAVIRHSSGSCVHPLWGGTLPDEGQNLCLYPDCLVSERLKYKFHVVKTGSFAKSTLNATLMKELNYIRIHYIDESVVPTLALAVQPKQLPVPDATSRPNIFVITLDEVSAAHFQRKLPLTYQFMNDEMKFINYDVHAAVAKTSRENILALLTGTASGNTKTFGLFDVARTSKYVSLFSADKPSSMFNATAADHSSIPLFASMKKYYDINAHAHCVASQPIYELTFSYLLSFIRAYPGRPKFAVAVLTEITQGNYNFIGYMDKMFKDLLEKLKDLKNTIMFVSTIKGSLTGKLGQLPQGVMEHRRPFLAAYVSQDVRETFEKERAGSLTSALDMFVTIKDLLSSEKTDHLYGKSLLEKTGARNCKEAGVATPMCPCT